MTQARLSVQGCHRHTDVVLKSLSRATTDVALLLDVASGDDAAFAQLHDRHHADVVQMAARIIRSRDVAEEIAQEVFFDLWRRPERFNPSRGTLAAFLVTQARGRAIDRIRSEDARRRRENRSGTDPISVPVIDSDHAEDRHDLTEALRSLDPDQRTPIELAYLHGFTYREVATHLDTAEGTVKSRIRAGLRNLHGTLGAA